jgi:rhodanese-related sulfurtransferase
MLPDPEETSEVSPAEVAKWVALPQELRPRLIDCREQEELEICQIPGNEWVPLDSFPQSLARLIHGNERGLVIYCHHGMRSLRAATFLRAHGVKNVFSMRGGIELWSTSINPEVPRY